MAEAATSRKREQSELSRERLIEAATRLFAERGYRDASVQAIGEAAAPVVVDCDGAGGVEVEEGGEVRELTAVSGAAPLARVHVHALPAMDVDPHGGEVTGTIGGLQHLAGAVGELAAALGGRSVATVQFATSDADAPLAVSARAGEPPVFALGDETFALPS